MEKFTAAIKIDPKLLEAYINRGIAEMKLSRGATRWAISTRPWSWTRIPPRPSITGAWPTAAQRVRQSPGGLHPGPKLAPKDWQIYYNRGNTYLDMNRPRRPSRTITRP